MNNLKNIQVPKSIKKIAKEVQTIVINNNNINFLEDIDFAKQYEWETKCNHELFYQDINRYIEDVAIYRNHNIARESWL
jgi:hypothetical protein